MVVQKATPTTPHSNDISKVIELQTLEEIVINDTLSHKALPLNFSDAPVCAA